MKKGRGPLCGESRIRPRFYARRKKKVRERMKINDLLRKKKNSMNNNSVLNVTALSALLSSVDTLLAKCSSFSPASSCSPSPCSGDKNVSPVWNTISKQQNENDNKSKSSQTLHEEYDPEHPAFS